MPTARRPEASSGTCGSAAGGSKLPHLQAAAAGDHSDQDQGVAAVLPASAALDRLSESTPIQQAADESSAHA
jgi:hypothetical protein